MSAPIAAWRRWTLLAALFGIGLVWVAAFALFRAHSEDYLAAHFADVARDRARMPAPALPLVLTFGPGRTGARLLGDGWTEPADDGVWSFARRAMVYLRWPAARGERWLTFEGEAFIPGRRGQHARLYADGALVGEWFADRNSTVVRGSARLAAPPRDGVVELVIEVDEIASPFSIGSGKDTRPLGFHLRTIELRDLPPGSPPPP